VKRLERSGGDWYYGLADSPERGTPGDSSNPPEAKQLELWALERLGTGPVWKTYASPATPFRLVGNTQTGALAVIQPGKPLPEAPWVAIPSCSVAQHAEIAKEFVLQIEELPKRSILQELIERAGSGPSSGFHQKVRDLGLGPAWARFRRDRILDHLKAALRSSGVEFSEVVDLKPVPPQRMALGLRDSHLPTSPSSPPSGLDIRKLAVAAVSRMSETELRSLPIPLGYVLDIIGDH
jgi:hypothetical protein